MSLLNILVLLNKGEAVKNVQNVILRISTPSDGLLNKKNRK